MLPPIGGGKDVVLLSHRCNIFGTMGQQVHMQPRLHTPYDRRRGAKKGWQAVKTFGKCGRKGQHDGWMSKNNLFPDAGIDCSPPLELIMVALPNA
jgi:hypothetical protein